MDENTLKEHLQRAALSVSRAKLLISEITLMRRGRSEVAHLCSTLIADSAAIMAIVSEGPDPSSETKGNEAKPPRTIVTVGELRETVASMFFTTGTVGVLSAGSGESTPEELSQILVACLRDHDIIAQQGDRLVFLLKEATPKIVEAVSIRIRKKTEGKGINLATETFKGAGDRLTAFDDALVNVFSSV